MITGAQIRLARALLGWDRPKLSKQSRVSLAALGRAEAVDGEPPVTMAHNMAVLLALEQAGIEFDALGEGWGARLRKERAQ
jgi:hypothetical protein